MTKQPDEQNQQFSNRTLIQQLCLLLSLWKVKAYLSVKCKRVKMCDLNMYGSLSVSPICILRTISHNLCLLLEMFIRVFKLERNKPTS